MVSSAYDTSKGIEREAERLCEVTNELDRLERLTGESVSVNEIADALGWSVTAMVEEVLTVAVALGCAYVPESGKYRLA